MRILVVDDDPVQLKMIATVLEKVGHTVERRGSCFGLVNKLAGRGTLIPPELCILDNHMPELSGLLLMRIIVKDKSAVKIPIILYTNDPTLKEDVENAGHPQLYYQLKSRPSDLLDRIDRVAVRSGLTSGEFRL